MAAATVEVAAGESLLPRVYWHRYAAICDLKTGLSRLGSGRCQSPHHHVTGADVESRTTADVVNPDELAVGERRRDLTQQFDHTYVVASSVVNVLVVRHVH